MLYAIKYLPDLKEFRWATVDGVIPLADEIVDALCGGKVEEFFMLSVVHTPISVQRRALDCALTLDVGSRVSETPICLGCEG